MRGNHIDRFKWTSILTKGVINMIIEVTGKKNSINIGKSINKCLLQFLDGTGYDGLLQFLLRGLYSAIVLFCIPYFFFMLVTYIF